MELITVLILAGCGLAVLTAVKQSAKKTKRKSKKALPRQVAKTDDSQSEPSSTDQSEPKKNAARGNWGLAEPENQISAVAKVNFEKTNLMNKSEYRVFLALEEYVAELGQGHRVMSQTSMGEFIKPSQNSGDWKDRKRAFASINSKRVDFCVIDKSGQPALVVEYQGSGHHQGKAFMRDAVKKEVLRRANVPFLEVEKGMKPQQLKMLIADKLS